MRLLLIVFTLCISRIILAQNSEFFKNKAVELGREGEYEKALNEIEKAIQLDSSNTDYLNTKGLYLAQLEQFQAAYDIYSKAIEIDSNSISFEGRGIILYNVGEFDMAIEDHTYAITNSESDDTKYTGYSNRAVAKMGKQDFLSAYDDLMIAYRYDSTNISVLTNLGGVCDDLGMREEALRYLMQVLEIDDMYYPAYGNIGFIYQEMGQHLEAIKWFDKLLEIDNNEPLGYSNRSFNKYKLGDLKGALLDIEKSIELYPENSYAYRTKALINIEQKRLREACKNIQLALDYGFTISYGNEMVELQKKYCRE